MLSPYKVLMQMFAKGWFGLLQRLAVGRKYVPYLQRFAANVRKKLQRFVAFVCKGSALALHVVGILEQTCVCLNPMCIRSAHFFKDSPPFHLHALHCYL